MKSHTLRTILAGVLALMAALVIIYAMLSMRAYFAGSPSAPGSQAPLTDEQKLEVLASLKASSTPSMQDSRKTLHALSASSSVNTTEQQKLDILSRLRTK